MLRLWRRLSNASSRDSRAPYLSAIVLVLIAFAIRFALHPLLNERSPLLIFTAAIVIAAGRYGIAPGLLAMILSLVLATAVFMAPGFPPVLSPDQMANIGVFIVTGGAMLIFAWHLKASQEREVKLQSALQQVQTETAMGTMAATLAHELNQPLAAAANYVGASKRIGACLQGDERATLISGLDEAEAQIHRAGEIIRQARKMVSSTSTVRQEASLREMVGNAVKPLQASGTARALRLQLEVDQRVDTVCVNPIQIEQVLLNVIRNACQAARPPRTAEVVLAASGGDGFTTVEVRDSGPGIDEEQMASLFRPGGESTTGGQGLGLSICRTIIESHGGKMWARNNDGSGASIFFTVPNEPGTA